MPAVIKINVGRRQLALAGAILFCSVSLGAQPITVRDGAGQVVTLQAPARRIA